MKIWHLTIASVDRHALFPDEAGRRRAVRVIVRVLGDALLLFCVVDDHVHVVLVCDERTLAALRSAIVRAFSTASGRRLLSHVKPVESRRHLLSLLQYLLTQVTHHGIEAHAASYSGSCFQDLVGARALTSLGARVARALPRLRQHELWQMAGLGDALPPADDDAVRRAGASRIAAAAAAALATGPLLVGRSGPTVSARRLAVHVGASAGITRKEMARFVGVTKQRAAQLATEPEEPRVIRAVRLRLAIEDALLGATLLRSAQ